MTIEEKFEKADGDFIQFEKIPVQERRHPCRDICAMLYLYEKLGIENDGAAVACAEHDMIYLHWNGEDLDKLTEEDVLYIHRCGVILHEEGLAMHV